MAVREVAAGAVVSAGAWRLRVLWPERRPAAGTDPNLAALVALAAPARFDVLLTADAESPVLGALPLRAVDVLKVAHHGSADPGLPALLRRVRPGAAVISVGPNRYGHPAPSTVAALRAAGVPVWRTDRQGDVTLTGREAEREPEPSATAATMGRDVSQAATPLKPAYAIWGEDRAKVERTMARWRAGWPARAACPPSASRPPRPPRASWWRPARRSPSGAPAW